MQMAIDFSLKNVLELRTVSNAAREREQVRLLRKHLAQAYRAPYYKNIIDANSIKIDGIVTIKDLSNLPLTERIDIEKEPESFYAVPKDLFADIAFTSGSIGRSLAIPYTLNDLERLAFNETINFYSAGVRPGDSTLLCVTLDRCFIAGLAYYGGLIKLGASVIRSGAGQPERQWELIHRCKPRGIVGVPSFLLKMAQWGEENGYRPDKSTVSKLITIGEPIRKADFTLTALGQKLEESWGAQVFSSYGLTELQTAFCECQKSCGGHVHPEFILAEIVDEDGNKLPNGQPGEVVVTPLGVEGVPLVRFRTGDISRLSTEPCECGWNTPRLGPIEGRLAQRLKFRGTTLYPEMVFQALDEIHQIDCSYIEVRSLFDLSDNIKVVVGIDSDAITQKRITELLQARLRVQPEVEVMNKIKVMERMRAAGGRKLKRFFDLRGS
jgi:phenylacetate-CoA ligase